MPVGDKLKAGFKGEATSIGAPENNDLIDKLRRKIMSNDTAYELTQNLGKLADVAGTVFSPESVSGGPATANIGMLAKSELATPELKKALEFIVKRYPRLSKIVRQSRFVTDPVEEWGDVALKKNRKGSFNLNEDKALISLNTSEGIPRSAEDVLNTIGHEILGHGRDYYKKLKGQLYSEAPDELSNKFYKEYMQEYNLPYGSKPSEVKAKKMGEALTGALKKRKILSGGGH